MPSNSPGQSRCDHPLGQDSSSQPEKPTPEQVHQLLNVCQEAARSIKHDVTGRQLASCLLSAPWPWMRDVIAGAHTLTTPLQLPETHAAPCKRAITLKISPSGVPWGQLGAVGERANTMQSRGLTTAYPGNLKRLSSKSLCWPADIRPLNLDWKCPQYTEDNSKHAGGFSPCRSIPQSVDCRPDCLMGFFHVAVITVEKN